jgi:hypothetical protein
MLLYLFVQLAVASSLAHMNKKQAKCCTVKPYALSSAFGAVNPESLFAPPFGSQCPWLELSVASKIIEGFVQVRHTLLLLEHR